MTITAINTIDAIVAAKRGRGTRRNHVSVVPPAESFQSAPICATKPPSKSAAVIKLLSRPKGATVPEIIAATDWQPHSVRAYLSGLRKKGGSFAREARKDGEQAYRLATPEAATTDQSKPAARSQISKVADVTAPASVDVTPALLASSATPTDATVA